MAENLSLQHRFRRDLEALAQHRPRLEDPDRLDRLTQDLEAEQEQEEPHHEQPDQAQGQTE